MYQYSYINYNSRRYTRKRQNNKMSNIQNNIRRFAIAYIEANINHYPHGVISCISIYILSSMHHNRILFRHCCWWCCCYGAEKQSQSSNPWLNMVNIIQQTSGHFLWISSVLIAPIFVLIYMHIPLGSKFSWLFNFFLFIK